MILNINHVPLPITGPGIGAIGGKLLLAFVVAQGTFLNFLFYFHLCNFIGRSGERNIIPLEQP